MADRVTCCPHCSTSFRITAAQLQSARGAVRCGSCLQIFRATDHLVPLPPTLQDAEPAPVSAAEPGCREPEPEPDAAYQDQPGQPDYPEADPTDDDPANYDLSDDFYLDAADEPRLSEDFDEPRPPADCGDEAAGAGSDFVTAAGPRSALFFDDPFAEDFPAEASEDLAADDDLAGETPSVAPLFDDLNPDEHEDDADFDLDLDEDLLISDDMDDQPGRLTLGELSDDFLDLDAGKPVKSSLFDRELKIKEVEDDLSDESWAEELLQEIETEEAPPPASGAESDILRSFGDLSSAAPVNPLVGGDDWLGHDTDNDRGDYRQLATGSFDPLDELKADDDEIDARLGEGFTDRQEPRLRLADEPESSADATVNAPAADTTSSAPQPGPAASAPLATMQSVAAPAGAEPPPLPTRERDLLLHSITPAPVEMHWQAETSPWPRRLLWGSLSLLAGALLAAQFAWFKFDEYSRIEPWRSAYAQVCPLLGCTLPSLSDPARVKAYNLVVRSHPQTPNALVIDSILLNTAGFPQPFPDFVLSFTNLQGRQLAYRRFTPQEYLGGELSGATLMPNGQPVHISLEIVDPGPDAVNYTATIPRD